MFIYIRLSALLRRRLPMLHKDSAGLSLYIIESGRRPIFTGMIDAEG
jgi:hypothetical protein